MSRLLAPRQRLMFAVALLGLAAWQLAYVKTASAQAAKSDKPAAKSDKADAKAPDLADQKFDAATSDNPSSKDPTATEAAKPGFAGSNDDALKTAAWWLGLVFKGGPLMIPIGLLSLVAVAFTIERAFGLRRGRVIPRRFVREMRALASAPGGFDPRKAYRLCQQYPSSAANVLRAVLLKAGRSTPEIEAALKESIDRENWRLNFNVRPLLLAVTCAPLLGLLGTVCGMIIAFYRTAEMPVGVDRAQGLAEGIYLKLITTMGGLAVAIPSLLVAFFFEGKIQRLLHDIEDLAHTILPQVEKLEGKLKTTRSAVTGIEPPPVAKLVDNIAVPYAAPVGPG